MPPFTATKKFNILGSNEAGVSLIETLIALALLGLIGAAFLSGLFTVSKATLLADEQATGESLARSAMEDVKDQDYIDYSADPHDVYDVYDGITPPAGSGYSIDIKAVPFDPDTGISYPQTGGIFEQDHDIQKITVTVERNGKSVLIVEDYKVYR